MALRATTRKNTTQVASNETRPTRTPARKKPQARKRTVKKT
ncbi:hypothetical protein [Vitiosangium sp. GDMCC 1.1324]|nr:hypothetical protein [Vitiosangium sp. GDMCC 1.1324]